MIMARFIPRPLIRIVLSCIVLDVWSQRAHAVREAFLHSYNGYLTHAAPHDELLPLSKVPIDNFNGWGLSLVESLDTMWLMGLYDEFDSALVVVSNMTFPMQPEQHAPFFETVIRYLGGLLSAYALSHDPILLVRADHLGNALLPAFGTPSGLPVYSVNTVNGKVAWGWTGIDALWSEALSCQLEYKYLAYLTGRTQYYTAVEKVMEIMYTANLSRTEDLFPTTWSTKSGLPSSSKVSVGAFADSAYEYMLKQWLLTGRTDTKARDLCMLSALYHRDLEPSHSFEHLTCFFPAVLALGSATLPDVPRTHMWAARALAYTCWTLYADSPSGNASSWDGQWSTHLARWEQSGAHGDPPGVGPASPVDIEKAREYNPINPSYLLRPETVESFYLLWRTTGDIVWRERGWAVFEALSREARIEDGGFASVDNVYHVGGRKRDEMPSWFLAETLKYLFLLFTDEDLIPLDQWVFNTEAHPLPVFQWSEWEMERFGII
ncbi:glycoside hydrolase [Multifurca ochricompacta]|uniref:alpha-1,2-Mannosidase n=1 Tax=Multifurca ochricompacta TaxID=376703 RepID=A0AAD4M972_9AGAM|nr:glycoside hydrolase [Multifurca ochricompacta]